MSRALRSFLNLLTEEVDSTVAASKDMRLDFSCQEIHNFMEDLWMRENPRGRVAASGWEGL